METKSPLQLAIHVVPPCWRAKVALGQDKQKTYIILNGNFLCLSCPGATFALQHGGFVPREWLAAKDLFIVTRHYREITWAVINQRWAE